MCVRDDTRAMAIYTVDGRAGKRRRLGHARMKAKERSDATQKTGGRKRCNPDGTRIRMTHGIIWVYVIREIRRRRMMTLPLNRLSYWLPRTSTRIMVSRCIYDA